MSNRELRAYYGKKVTVCLDVLDELERLKDAPSAPGIVRQNAEEAKLDWQREFALASTQYDGVRSGLSTLPLPPQAMRDRLSALGDRVEPGHESYGRVPDDGVGAPSGRRIHGRVRRGPVRVLRHRPRRRQDR